MATFYDAGLSKSARSSSKENDAPVKIKKHPYPKFRKRGIRLPKVGQSQAEYLQSLSKFGGTSLERLADGAAYMAGFQFDAAQYAIYFPDGNYTVADRVIFNPQIAVFLDGPVHDFRRETAQGDFVKRIAAQSLGWRVSVINWKDFEIDPIKAIRQVWFAS